MEFTVGFKTKAPFEAPALARGRKHDPTSKLWRFGREMGAHISGKSDGWWNMILFINIGCVLPDSSSVSRLYLIDTVLNIKDEHSADRLWIPGDRDGTAICDLSNEGPWLFRLYIHGTITKTQLCGDYNKHKIKHYKDLYEPSIFFSWLTWHCDILQTESGQTVTTLSLRVEWFPLSRYPREKNSKNQGLGIQTKSDGLGDSKWPFLDGDPWHFRGLNEGINRLLWITWGMFFSRKAMVLFSLFSLSGFSFCKLSCFFTRSFCWVECMYVLGSKLPWFPYHRRWSSTE